MHLLDQAMARERLLRRSQEAYRGCAARFIRWSRASDPSLSSEERVSQFLAAKAPHWSASSQNQHLCAIVFFYRAALSKPLGKLPAWASAQKAKRLPSWLSDGEMRRVLALLRGEVYLAGALMYGSGMRVSEVVRLRRRDVMWSEGTIMVRDGKGEKDRVTCLPRTLAEDLMAQDQRAAAMWAEDRQRNIGPVSMPEVVTRKQPRAGFEPGNFWLFFAAGLVRDRAKWGDVRHHLDDSTINKAVRLATRRAQLTKRVTAHVFRHSFATQYLLNGGNIYELSKLLGHTTIATTEIYLHCLPRLGARIESPLDRAPSNIVPWPQGGQVAIRRAS